MTYSNTIESGICVQWSCQWNRTRDWIHSEECPGKVISNQRISYGVEWHLKDLNIYVNILLKNGHLMINALHLG